MRAWKEMGWLGVSGAVQLSARLLAGCACACPPSAASSSPLAHSSVITHEMRGKLRFYLFNLLKLA
jgi:hypothetical protein